MEVLYLLLLVGAAACFALAAFRATREDVGRRTSVNLVALGLLFWVLVPLIQHIKTMSAG